jgi:hypothetical protein
MKIKKDKLAKNQKTLSLSRFRFCERGGERVGPRVKKGEESGFLQIHQK